MADVEGALDSLMEELAALEHERWAHWQTFVHSKGSRQTDGSLVLPPELVERWERQLRARYDELTDEEKESDREQVRKYFPLLVKWLSAQRGQGTDFGP